MSRRPQLITQTDVEGAKFADAIGRLVRVPKSDVDAEEAKYKAMRKRLKDKAAKKRSKGS